jgi:hypothetical protein
LAHIQACGVVSAVYGGEGLVELEQLIKDKYISVEKHPTDDLFIYNYTQKAQFDYLWNEHTETCRGLIKDGQGNIVSRPFRKFFNLGQDTVLPLQPFEVYEKLDGSLGVLYWIGETPYISTRGSFVSDQAKKATQMLHGKYRHTWNLLERDKTYLFEIIYPENKIVCDYGKTEDLFLLAVIDTVSGFDVPLQDVGFPIVKRYDGISDLSMLQSLAEDNREGFVVKFDGGLRVKVKFEEYVRLHRLITLCSNVIIWERLSKSEPLDEIIEKVPDEFHAWVKRTSETLTQQFAEVERECKSVFKVLESRKETALYYQTQKYPFILFAMMDNKDYVPMIWKTIKPKFSKPFKADSATG